MGARARLAAIDIGTVTTRLLVADVGDDGIAEVERSTDITHLGAGLSATGCLSPEAMRRVADVLERYERTMRELGVERFSAIATSASRDADTGDEFLALLAERGVVPRIVPGDVEARLAFVGATAEMSAVDGLLVADLGGGSTELVFGSVTVEGGVRSAEIERARSIDVGSKRVTELFLHSDPPAPAEMAEARTWIAQQLRPYFAELREKPRVLVSLAGTATSLSAIRQGLAVYDSALVHESVLSGAELADLVEALSALTLAERERVPGLDPGRAPVIVAGALILETLVALAGLETTLVSEHDILYGILLDTYRDLREETSASKGVEALGEGAEDTWASSE